MASTRETIIVAVQAALAAFEGTYPPDAVYRQVFMPEGFTPDPTHRTAYYLWPVDRGTRSLGPSSCELSGTIPLAVRAYRRLTNATENPSSGNEPERWQFQNEMFEDIVQALYANQQVGGARRIADGVSGDWSIQEASYACVEVQFTFEYGTSTSPMAR
jgi:hypothetical protein